MAATWMSSKVWQGVSRYAAKAVLPSSDASTSSDGNVHYLPFASQQIWHSRQDKHVVTSDEGEGGGQAIISGVINDGASPC